MLRNLLAQVASITAVTTLGGWVYVNYFYKGGRRRKAGGHRFGANSVVMMYAEVRPNPADRTTWYQVPISKNLPALGVA